MGDKEFFTAVRRYIEDAERKIDAEWGSCRSLEELILAGEMPDLYAEVLRRIGAD
jgi:hypothetical protein